MGIKLGYCSGNKGKDITVEIRVRILKLELGSGFYDGDWFRIL